MSKKIEELIHWQYSWFCMIFGILCCICSNVEDNETMKPFWGIMGIMCIILGLARMRRTKLHYGDDDE
jgi:hypothetical protein